jgi:hypothetical protein
VVQELLTFRSTRGQPRFLVGFMVLNLLCVHFIDRRVSCPHDGAMCGTGTVIISEHPSSPLVFSVVRVALTVVFYVMYGI